MSPVKLSRVCFQRLLRIINCCDSPGGKQHINLWVSCGFLGVPVTINNYNLDDDFQQACLEKCHHNLISFIITLLYSVIPSWLAKVQLRDKRPKIYVRNVQFAYTRRRLSVRTFLMHLISMYESAYCLLRVLISLLVLADIYCKSMAR